MEKEKNFTLKRITNRKKQKAFLKTKSLSPSNNSIPSPQKFLNPFPFHRTFSDLIIFDNPQQYDQIYISPIYSLFNLKHISSVDYQDEFLCINLEDTGNYPFSPFEMIYSRLRSLNNLDSYNFANSLKENFEIFNILIKTATFQPLNNTLSPEMLIFLRDFFLQVMNNSMGETDFFIYFRQFQKDNTDVPNFCLVYTDFKPFFGMELSNFIMSHSMKRIIPCDELNLIDEDFLCLETSKYFKLMVETTKRMHSTSHLAVGDIFVKTKIGLKRMVYDMRKFFINNKKSRNRIYVHFTFKKDEVLAEVLEKIKTIEEGKCVELGNVSFKKKNQKIEKSDKWNDLIELYFGSAENEKSSKNETTESGKVYI